MAEARAPGLSRANRLTFSLITLAGVPILALIVIEGASSLVLSARRAVRNLSSTMAAANWLEHHPQIGTVPRPNVDEPDMFGPGVYLRTNAQGFRGDRAVSTEVPPGTLRVLCSGDSYTLGQEVSDHETWCELLRAHDPRLETVNLGVSGYGWDQAYLRYRHQGTSVEHDVHLFAFITSDLYRMRASHWRWPWQTPLLSIQDGELVADEPPCATCAGPLAIAAGHALGQLRSVELLASAGRRIGVGEPVQRDTEVAELAEHIVRELAVSPMLLLLVHLPVIQDYSEEGARIWREYLREVAVREGADYIDLIEPLRKLPADSIAILFLPAEADPGRHYTAEGHEWIAQQLYARLEDRLRKLAVRSARNAASN